MAATDDQLRVLAWVLTDAQDRFVALNEARQRRALPEVRKKAEEAGEMEPEDLRLWIAPLQQMQGRRVSPASVDRMYKEFFGPELI
jgi:hypothetical protein